MATKNIVTLWGWFNGRKTTIGAGLLLAAMVLAKMSEIWIGADAGPDWIPRLIDTLEYFGGALSGVGLAHKGVKAVGMGVAGRV